MLNSDRVSLQTFTSWEFSFAPNFCCWKTSHPRILLSFVAFLVATAALEVQMLVSVSCVRLSHLLQLYWTSEGLPKDSRRTPEGLLSLDFMVYKIYYFTSRCFKVFETCLTVMITTLSKSCQQLLLLIQHKTNLNPFLYLSSNLSMFWIQLKL